MLVEDQTWQREMQAFFKASGAIFDPVRVLHGTTIQEFKREQTAGREVDLGVPTLDPARLQQCRVVITNYETVKNYQHSFAQTVNGQPIWSILVTDEAQEYKTPNTKISHAIKALQPSYHIACTGTPVENRLLDIWNLFDTLQPALLGTAREFTTIYEKPLSDGDGQVLGSLKDRLLFGRANAFLVRRDKGAMTDLPRKGEVRLDCAMTEAETALHLDLVSGLRQERREGSHLAVLHKLAQLYQHVGLVDESWERTAVGELVRRSSKLRAVVEQLREIKSRGEKAIIFARFLAMQQILASVLGEEFDLRVHIINGSTVRGPAEKSSALSKRAKETRARILADFKTRPGFNVLVLSPFVAGIGLTITEANHVFHYGRWWNPAVEAQATDRVYRIGQERDVRVYLPILKDHTGRIRASFDECLDTLLQTKSGLARNFLRPPDDEKSAADELCESLLGGEGAATPQVPYLQPLCGTDIDRMTHFDFEALVARLYEVRGFRTVLTARANDGGADVVALSGDEVWLIQTKHSEVEAPVGPEALGDVLGAQTIYQQSIPRRCRLAVVTNARLSGEALQQANQLGIATTQRQELVAGVRDAGITIGQVVLREQSRCPSFRSGIQAIERILGTAHRRD